MANGRCPQCNNLVLKGNVTQGSCEVECDRCKHHFVLKPAISNTEKKSQIACVKEGELKPILPLKFESSHCTKTNKKIHIVGKLN